MKKVYVEIVPATQAHIEEMAPLVRQPDVDEMWAVAYKSPLEALMIGFRLTDTAWTGKVNGKPVCIFGVAPSCLLTGTGAPWLLGTDDIEKYAAVFIRHSRKRLKVMFDKWDRLVNYVDARNKKAVRWLRWMGFTIYEPEAHGVIKLPFHRFEMIREGF